MHNLELEPTPDYKYFLILTLCEKLKVICIPTF